MTPEFRTLGAEKYVLMTTFRKSGVGVPTAIWAAPAADELLVWTARDAGKVKRVRNNGRVELQACDSRGKNQHGPVLSGTARILDDAGTKRTRDALRTKYGLVARLAIIASGVFRGPSRTIGLAITENEHPTAS